MLYVVYEDVDYVVLIDADFCFADYVVYIEVFDGEDWVDSEFLYVVACFGECVTDAYVDDFFESFMTSPVVGEFHRFLVRVLVFIVYCSTKPVPEKVMLRCSWRKFSIRLKNSGSSSIRSRL